MPTIYVLSNNKNNNKFLLKTFNFYDLGKICFLHGRVFVMLTRDMYYLLLALIVRKQ